MAALRITTALSGRDRMVRSCGAIDLRAHEVSIHYEYAARCLDELVVEPAQRVVGADVLRGVVEPGPVLTLLREFPPCEGVVWGCYAEASQAAHRRMAFIADTHGR